MATIIGTDDDDILYGNNNQSDTIRGGLGNDRLQDKSGDFTADVDRFYGGAGADIIKSLYGSALMDGGTGNDEFFFKAGKTGETGWDADVYWNPGDFLTIDNTDDGVSTAWIGFGHHELRVTVDVEGGVTSTITIHSDGDISKGDIDYI